METNNTTLEQMKNDAVQQFISAGLDAVAVKSTHLLLIGGKYLIESDSYGYLFEEPRFSVFHRNGEFIACVDDMRDFENNEPQVTSICGTIDEAVQFITNYISEYLKETAEQEG